MFRVGCEESVARRTSDGDGQHIREVDGRLAEDAGDGRVEWVARKPEITVETINSTTRSAFVVGLGVNNCASVTTTKGELVQEIHVAVRCPRGTKREAMGWVGARAWPPRRAQLDTIRTSSRTPWEVWPDDE